MDNYRLQEGNWKIKTLKLINSKPTLPESAQLGRVSLVVRDLKASIEFYTKVLKMTIHQQDDSTALLGNTEAILLELKENKTAKQYLQATGLYHFAIIYPSERELAEAIAWLFALRFPNSPTDHGYSKTTYLTDPDGTTIELYVRTPERGIYQVDDNGEVSVHYADGRVGNGRDSLDLNQLFATLNDDISRVDAPLSSSASIGHVHLFSHNIQEMMVFYRDIIGFGEGMILEGFQMGDMALSEDKFHVVAFNQWKGNVLPPPQPNIGMHHYTLVVSIQKSYEELQKRLKQAEINTISHQEGFFVNDPAGLAIYITNDDSKLSITNTDH